MTTNKKTATRWGFLTAAGLLIVLVVAGALFAQTGPNRDGGRAGQRGGGGSFGGQQGMMGGGPGGGMGNQGGPQAMLGAQFLMQDPEIVELIAVIKVVEGINRLELTYDQVDGLRDLAVEAQRITDSQFGATRNEVKNVLESQLDNVLAGGEFDQGALRSLMEEHRESHDPGDIRTQMEDILERAKDLFTEDQLQRIANERPDRGRWNQDEFQNRNNRGGFTGRDGQGIAKMKLMMMMLSPMAVDGMDVWLDAQ